MDTKDKAAFSAIMSGLGELYGKEMTPFLMRAYWETLKDFSIEAVENAAISHMAQTDKACQFMPKPGDIRAMIGGSTNDAAIRAWETVMRAIRDYGSYQSVAFSDPVIHKVVLMMGGWPAIGQLKTDELPFAEARFCKHYTANKQKQGGCENEDYPAYLAGLSEADNRLHGHNQHIQKPIIVDGKNKGGRLNTITSNITKKIIGFSERLGFVHV